MRFMERRTTSHSKTTTKVNSQWLPLGQKKVRLMHINFPVFKRHYNSWNQYYEAYPAFDN